MFEVHGGSKLVLNQLLLHCHVKKDDLIPYFQYATPLLERPETMMLEHVPSLTAILALAEDELVKVSTLIYG